MRSMIALLAAILAFATPAMAQPVIGGKVNNPAADAAEAVLAKPLVVENFAWSYGPATQLPRVSTHICLLSGFSGKLAGAGELGKLFIDTGAPGGPRYMLGGTSQQSQFKVMAHCASRSQFVWSGANPAQPKVSALVQGSGCATQSRVIKDVSGAPFLAAFGGRFAGAGEMVAVLPSLFGAQGRISACSGTLTTGAIGYASAFPMVYRTQSARTNKVNADTSFFFAIGSNANDSLLHNVFGEFKWLQQGTPDIVPYNEAFCGLTGITGKFNGYGESVQLAKMGNFWWTNLNFSQNANEPYVGAAARCLSRDQRPVS